MDAEPTKQFTFPHFAKLIVMHTCMHLRDADLQTGLSA